MEFKGFNGLTLLDFPGMTAAMVYTGGCNFKCPYCHNAVLVEAPGTQPSLSEEDIIGKLSKRKGMLEGLVITGGEPTLHPDLPEFCRKVKAEGFLVKLDTNGTNPDMIARMISEGLVDYIAMDVKAGNAEGYSRSAGLDTGADTAWTKIWKTALLLMNECPKKGIRYEFRTTVVDGIHTADDFREITKLFKGASAYYLQAYKPCEGINPKNLKFSTPSKETLEGYADIVRPAIPSVQLRGVD